MPNEYAPSESMAYDEAEQWISHHHREHSGEFESCTSKVCTIALDLLTRIPDA